MNIGIVTYWFERGAAYVSRAYVETLSKDNNVFIYSRGGEETAIGNPYWDLPYVTWAKKLRNIDQGKYIIWEDFKKWLKKNNIEIIIFNEQQSWDVILRLRKSKYIIGAYVDYYTFETVRFFNLYDFLLCNTKRHYEVFQEHKQAYFIQWGTDVEVCRPQPRKKISDEIVFFHSAGMGGINLRKGTDLLVRAFKNVKGPARLIIHSQVDIEKYSYTAELIEQDSRIQFIKGTYPLPGLYHLGDVYAYPSKLEGIGLSIAEALACGLPVITTDAAPMNEFIEHGKTGSLVDVIKHRVREDRYYWPESICSETALTNRMQAYVDDRATVKKQSKNARNAALEKFDWQKNSKLLPTIMQDIQKTRSWNTRDIREVKRFEFQRNIFIVDARLRLSEGDKKTAWKSTLRLIYHHPLSLLRRETLLLVVDLLFEKGRKRNTSNYFNRLSMKILGFLPKRIQSKLLLFITGGTILKSCLFDKQWYLAYNPDVRQNGVDPLFHYLVLGAIEGRNPSLFFDGNRYLENNPDVKKSGLNPLVHYLYYGRNEKRSRFSVRDTQEKIVIDDNKVLFRRKLDMKELDEVNNPVDIVIWVPDGLSEVQRCMESVIPTLRPIDKIILIDDKSKKATREYLTYIQRILPDKITLLHTNSERSLSRMMNLAISNSEADYTVLLKSDSIVCADWLSKLITITVLDQRVGIVSPLTNAYDISVISSTWDANTSCAKKSLSTGIAIEDINRRCEHLSESYGHAVVPFVQTSCYLIKRDVFQAIGLFEEDIFQNYYDVGIDFCFRAADAGFKCVTATDTYVQQAKAMNGSGKIKAQQQIKGTIKRLETRYTRNRVTLARNDIANNPILKEMYADLFRTFTL